MEIEFDLNGEQIRTDVPPDKPLRDVLREELRHTGTKKGCESAQCGVCTVHLDGDPVKSCVVMAGKADGRSVTTIEGIADDAEVLHEVQQAFVDHSAAQCGYCTPGFVMSAVSYVEDGGTDDRTEIRSALKGNLCRCTGYEKILEAVEDVARPSD